MTSPDRYTPPTGNPADTEANRIQGLFANGLKDPAGALLGQVVSGIGGAIRDLQELAPPFLPVRDAIRDLIAPVNQKLGEVEASQLDYAERLALLDGVRAYGAAYLPFNYGGPNGNTWGLPFIAPMGPMKGVSISSEGGLRIAEPGLWLISVRTTGRATIYTNAFGVQDRTELRVMQNSPRPGTGRTPMAKMTGDGGVGQVSNAMTFPAVIEEANTTILVEAYSSRWRYWDGGKLYSNLSLTKLDNRVVDPGDWTVPDA